MSITVEKLRVQKEARKKRLDHAFGEIIDQLKEMGALKIIAFGSYISGDIRRWSDLDFLVVMPPTRSGKEWFKEIYDNVERGVATDILPFTERELKKKIKTSSFIRHALTTGRVVYEKV